MRLFVALELPPSVQRDLGRRLTELQRQWGSPRWVPERNWHVTLSFLGEVAAERRPAVEAALRRAAAAHRPDALRLQGAGSFPPARPARVLWIGVQPPEPVIALQSDLCAQLAAAGLPGDAERPFHPHVTIARCRPPARRQRVDEWHAALGGYSSQEFPMQTVTLIHSVLERPASRYEALAHVPLGAATA